MLDTLLLKARTHNVFLDKPVSEEQLRQIHEIMRWGPTSQNSQPARIVFARSKEGKEKLRPALNPGNLDKTMAAPVTAILAYDSAVLRAPAADLPAQSGREEQLHRRGQGGGGAAHRLPQRHAAGRLFHHRCARDRPRCRRDERLQQRDCRPGIFSGWPLPVEFPVQHRLRRPLKLFTQNPRLGFEDVCSFA